MKKNSILWSTLLIICMVMRVGAQEESSEQTLSLESVKQEESSKWISPLEPVKSAILIMEKMFHGERLTGAEIIKLENNFTQDGFANLIGSFDYHSDPEVVFKELGLNYEDFREESIRKRFTAFANAVADAMVNDEGKLDPWIIIGESGILNGETIEFHLEHPGDDYGYSYGRYLAENLLSQGFLKDDRLVVTNDPMGDDESYVFILTGKSRKIKAMILVG